MIDRRTDPVLRELEEDDMDNMTDACIAILNIVKAVKGEIGTEKIVVNVRIAPDGTSVEVEPWEPYESDIKAVVDSLVDKMIGRK